MDYRQILTHMWGKKTAKVYLQDETCASSASALFTLFTTSCTFKDNCWACSSTLARKLSNLSLYAAQSWSCLCNSRVSCWIFSSLSCYTNEKKEQLFLETEFAEQEKKCA